MPETVADPPARSCYSLISETDSGGYQWVGPDLFGLARALGCPPEWSLAPPSDPGSDLLSPPWPGFDLIGQRLPWGDRRRLRVDMPAGRCARDARPGGFSPWCPSTDRGSPGRSARETRSPWPPRRDAPGP